MTELGGLVNACSIAAIALARFSLMTTPVDEDGSGDQLVTKDYVDNACEWLREPVEDEWDISGGLPTGLDLYDGVRYISDGTDEELGWYDGFIYEWDADEGEWIEEIPFEGWMVWLIAEMVFWVFFSGGWMEEGEDTYVLKAGDTMTGTLSFTDTYYPSPASDEPAIRANRDIVIKSGHKLIFDGA
jgi:hypothetical protein